MTTATFKYIDTTSYEGKPWGKVDGPGTSFKLEDHRLPVASLREQAEGTFTTETCGFQLVQRPAKETAFTDEQKIREGYYGEVEELLKAQLGGVKKVVIFDHTIRRRVKGAPRQPVQQVHVDQTPWAAAARVRRHVEDQAEAEELLRGRYAIINVWRPIENPAEDFPLGVIDWRTTAPADFVKVDLLYPKRVEDDDDGDDRGKEVLPDEERWASTEGYEAKGETFGVRYSEGHRFYYVPDMKVDEVMLLKCFDSFGEGEGEGGDGEGRKGLAVRTPHTAFVDERTRESAPGRQSIEVRCLVFYD